MMDTYWDTYRINKSFTKYFIAEIKKLFFQQGPINILLYNLKQEETLMTDSFHKSKWRELNLLGLIILC